MRLSTKGRYALRAMLDLALHADEGPISREDIARRQEISAFYLAQLFNKLSKAGLALSVKGPGGGYVLARCPEEISVGDIIRAVEGPIALVHCVVPEDETACPRAEGCVARLLWKRLSKEVAELMDSITLKDLCEQAMELMTQ